MRIGLLLLLPAISILAACGGHSVFENSMVVSDELKQKMFTPPTTPLTPSTAPAITELKDYTVYRIIDARYGTSSDKTSMSATVNVESTAGIEVVELVGAIRADGSASLVDLHPLSDSQNRLVAEGLCADGAACTQIILNVYFNVDGKTHKRQFSSDSLRGETTKPGSTPVSLGQDKDNTPVDGDNSRDGDEAHPSEKGLPKKADKSDEELGDFVGAPRNEILIGKLWKRSSTPELPPVFSRADEPKDMDEPADKPAQPEIKKPAPTRRTIAPAPTKSDASKTPAKKATPKSNSAPNAATKPAPKPSPQTETLWRRWLNKFSGWVTPAPAKPPYSVTVTLPKAKPPYSVTITLPKARNPKAKPAQVPASKPAPSPAPKPAPVPAPKPVTVPAPKLAPAPVSTPAPAPPIPPRLGKPTPQPPVPPVQPRDPSQPKPPGTNPTTPGREEKPKPPTPAPRPQPTPAPQPTVPSSNGADVSSTYPFPPAKPIKTDDDLDQKLTLLEAKLAPLLNLRDGGESRGGYTDTAREGVRSAVVNASLLPSNVAGLVPVLVTPNAHFGSGMLVSFLENAASWLMQQLNIKLYVGDMSLKNGGKYGNGSSHNTHRNGLDADIAWIGIDKPLITSALTSRGDVIDNFDYEKTWKFLSLAAHQEIVYDAQKTTAVSRVFMSPAIKVGFCNWAKENKVLDENVGDNFDSELMRLIRPTAGHYKHFHLSLKCSPHYRLCRNLAGPPPEGTGCSL